MRVNCADPAGWPFTALHIALLQAAFAAGHKATVHAPLNTFESIGHHGVAGSAVTHQLIGNGANQLIGIKAVAPGPVRTMALMPTTSPSAFNKRTAGIPG